jgi:ribosome-associated protein
MTSIISNNDTEEYHRPSKSAQKRATQTITDLGEKLVGLPPAALESMPLNEAVLEAIKAARTMKKGALKRQVLYIGKLLRQQDTAELEAAMAQHENRHQLANQHFHQLEHWRDQLIGGDEALATFLLDTYSQLTGQELYQLIHQAQRASKQTTPNPKAAKALFRYLRDHTA